MFIFKKANAGMTVEAAVILPLLLFFFLNLMSAVEMIRLHGNLELALLNTGHSLTIYGYEYDHIRRGDYSGTETKEPAVKGSAAQEPEAQEHDNSLLQDIGGIAFSYLYVKNKIVDYLGKEYLDGSPLAYGTDGLNFTESRFFEEEDIIDLTVTYKVSLPASIPGFFSFRMANRFYGRAWTGYQVCPDGETSGEDVVYVTETGRVFHETAECSYLRLRICSIPLEQAILMTNENGERYTKCWKCKSGCSSGNVWITTSGQRYHTDGQCPGLKRTIYTIPRSQAGEYRPCSRCAGG